MKLTQASLSNATAWESIGVALPQFCREAVRKQTLEAPGWVHFGAGNIFRAFPAAVMQKLLNSGLEKTGIIVAEGFDYEIIDKANKPFDNLSLLVTLKAGGETETTVIGSIVESYKLDTAEAADYAALKAVFENPSLQMASFTITEKGYSLVGGDGKTLGGVAKDLADGPAEPVSYMGKVASLLYARYQAGAAPLAMVSMDNCSHNGDKLAAAISAFAKSWSEAGLADKGFAGYVCTSGKVSFPWSMIDKITPRPDKSVEAALTAAGLEDMGGTVTSRNTFVAPFVNAEETEYLVIEDVFPNGRPALDKGGVIFTDRETVDKVEKMKVCTCLNPLHTALAIYGCLLGYESISAEMKDAELVGLIKQLGYVESLPVVVDPGILSPSEFIDTVINVRLPNPFIPDTPQRIASDTSQKLSIRFGETIKAYQARADLDVQDLRLINLVQAGWVRYLLGVNDKGQVFDVSPDPILPAMQKQLAGVTLGQTENLHEALKPILSDASIFGVDLYAAGLGDRVEAMLAELNAGPGAVRATLKKYI